MSIKDKIENNVTIWLLGTLLTGFMAGMASYGSIQKIGKLKVITIAEYDTLTKNSGLNTNRLPQQKALNRLVSKRFENALRVTSGKVGATKEENDEIQFKRLRKAVFQQMLSFQANTQILKNALETLESRGFKNVSVHKSRLLREMPHLKSERLRWLEDKAIPALQKSIEPIQRSFLQSVPKANVPLPKIAWILDHKNGEISDEIVTNMSLLEEEVSVLKEAI